MNRDKYGLIGQIRGDNSMEGGDSLCWNGHWEFLHKNCNRPRRIVKMDKYKVGFGAYVRHPYLDGTDNGFGAYYKHPWDGVISRDQFTGLLLGLIAEKNKKALLEVGINWACRGFLFTYNTRRNGKSPYAEPWKIPDITGPDLWATYLRGFGGWSWLFWPLLFFFDIHFILNSFIHNYKKESDVINFVGKILVSIEHCPTPASLIAWDMLDKKQLLDELKNYWSGWRDLPEFFWKYETRIEKHEM